MKKKILYIACCILILAILQASLMDYAKINNVKPNLLLTFIIIAAYMRGSWEGAAVGFFAGLIQDMISGKVIGLYALLGMYLGLIVGSLNKRIYRENIIISVFFTFIFSFIYEAVFYALYKLGTYFFDGRIKNADIFFAVRNIVLPEAIYNSVVSIVLFIIFLRINRRLEIQKNTARRY